LQDIREPLIKRIIDVGSEVLAKIKASQPIDILKLIINPFILINGSLISCNASQHNTKCCKVSSAFLHRLQVAEIRCVE
jgi:hypothetical protein